MNEFEDLEWFDSQECKPQYQVNPQLDSLPDGDYEFAIVSAELTKTPKSGDRIVKTTLQPAGGFTVERTWFLKDVNSMNGFLADLVCLGFDADKWGSKPGQKLLSKELPQAVTKMVGIRFRGRKETQQGKDGKTYCKLWIAGLSKPGGTSVMPAKNGVTLAQPQPSLAAPSADIPF